ncbi:MAG TPA: hypothetical protein VGB30_12055 [bacterium]|jgi:type II secretory pathway component GspD/PulD (secretin)
MKPKPFARGLILFLIFNLAFPVIPLIAQDEARDMEFVPIYSLTQDEAIVQLYTNLALVGITEDDIVVTTLPSVTDKIVLQGSSDIIEIAKNLLRTIDPAPSPPSPPPAELIDSFRIRNLSPSEFSLKLDEVMNNFIGMVKLEPSSDNFIIYAKNAEGAGQVTFYIPNLEAAVQAFTVRPQGYIGYEVYIRATSNEQAIINSAKNLIVTIDTPVAVRSYEVLNLYYIEIQEAINSLKAAGYTAVNTSDGVDNSALDALNSGIGPIIYTAPQVHDTSNTLSTDNSTTGNGIRGNQFSVLEFNNAVATTDIHKLVIFGTPAEIESVKVYLALIDVPARQVLIEAQVIELNVDDLNDLGLRNVTGTDDILSTTVNPVFPGEQGSSSTPGGNFFIYNDAGAPAGSFNATLAALILDGRATVRARPKVVTIDGRQAIINIGRQVPVIEETITGENRSTFEINFVPVGITLNIKPRIGQGGDEVQMQVDAVVSNVETLNNVVSELSLVAPELNTREVSTIVRIPNHQSLILGGLISTQEETREYRVPLLGDLPFIGRAFRRTREIRDRTEIIIVITPHVAEEVNPRPDQGRGNQYQIDDSYLMPLGSDVLDNLDNVLFPGEYIIKDVDLRGIDLTTGQPSIPVEQIVPFSTNDPVMLTLLQITRKLNLIDNLKFMQGIEIPSEMDPTIARYHAEAFLLAYLRHLNDDLQVNDLVAGRRLIVPAFPIPEEGFAEPELRWHTINYLGFTRMSPLLTGLADTIRWLDEQPLNDPFDVFTLPGSHIEDINGPTEIDPETGLPVESDGSDVNEDPGTGDDPASNDDSSGDEEEEDDSGYDFSG